MGNTVLWNTAGSIALAVNYVIQGPYSNKFLTKQAAKTARINAEFYVRVDDAVFCIESDVDVTESDLDVGESFENSQTYYVYACHPLDGTDTPVFKVSKNGIYPSGGWTADNSRKIGGFGTDGGGDINESTLWDLRTQDIVDTGVASDVTFAPAGRIQSTNVQDAIEEMDAHGHVSAYGVRWNTSTDVMTAGIVSGGEFIASDYVDFPVQQQMRRCVMNPSGVVQYYLHPEDSTKKESGESANIDGTDGQVMVEVPLFYYLICTDGDYKYFLVSERPFSLTLSDSSVKMARRHEWFEEGGTLSEKKYMSAFEGVLYDDGTSAYVDGDGTGQYSAGDKIHSVYGYKPITHETRATFRTACAVDTAYHQIGHWAYEAILLLYLTEYKSWDSQTQLQGYTEGGAWDFNKVCKTGITKTLGNKSGSINWEDADAGLRCSTDQTGKVVANSFRGVENLYGHIWKWVDGINVQWIGDPFTDADVYTCNNPDDFADDTDSNYTDEGVDLPLDSGYQKDLHDDCLLPASVGGSSSTYITDHFWASAAAGWRVVQSGGNLACGASAGAAARSAGHSSFNRHENIGGRPAA